MRFQWRSKVLPGGFRVLHGHSRDLLEGVSGLLRHSNGVGMGF